MSQSVAQPVVNKSEIINYFNQWKHFRSSFEGFQLIMESQFNALDRLHDEYMRQHEEYEKYRATSDDANRRLKNELTEMESKYTTIKEELANLKKVSIYTHLSKEMDDLRNYNAILEKQVKQLRAQQSAKTAVVELPATVVSNNNNDEYETKEEVEEEYDPQKDRVEDSDVDEASGVSDVDEADDDNKVDNVEEQVVSDADEDDAEAEEQGDTNAEEQEDIEEDADNDSGTEEAEDEEEPEIEYESRKIGKKYYYVSNEEPAGIYLVIKGTGEVGDKVGEYDENDKPVFHK